MNSLSFKIAVSFIGPLVRPNFDFATCLFGIFQNINSTYPLYRIEKLEIWAWRNSWADLEKVISSLYSHLFHHISPYTATGKCEKRRMAWKVSKPRHLKTIFLSLFHTHTHPALTSKGNPRIITNTNMLIGRGKFCFGLWEVRGLKKDESNLHEQSNWI